MEIAWAPDPIMARLVAHLPPPPLRTPQDPYRYLLRSVVGQQLSVRVATAIWERFLQLFPSQQPSPAALLHLSDAGLRSVGLSAGKSAYVRNIAQFATRNPLTTEALAAQTDEEIIAYLTSIKGVGRWTVEMVLLFALGRPDVFAVDDLVIRQMMVQLYDLTETGAALRRKLETIAEVWRPHRSRGCYYLWAARDSGLDWAEDL